MRLGVTVVLTGAVLLVSGCGGSSSNDTATFKREFTPVVNQFKSVSQAIGSEIQTAATQSDAQIATALHQLAGRWQTQVAALGSLKPPSSVSSDFSTLKTSVTRAGGDLTAIADAADKHDKAGFTADLRSTLKDIVSAKSASTKITTRLGIN